MMENKKSTYLIDLRSPSEFAEGHIVGSYNIPHEEISNIQKLIRDYNAPIFLWCDSGKHSRSAMYVLKYLGYDYVYDMGRVDGWPYGLTR
jgi:rhodanese-related sulfurtransferase